MSRPLTDESGEVRELTKRDIEKMRPMSEVLPELTKQLVAAQKSGKLEAKPMGRPKQEVTKQSATIRLDPEVIEYFKKDGRGWQTRLNDVLKEYVESHS